MVLGGIDRIIESSFTRVGRRLLPLGLAVAGLAALVSGCEYQTDGKYSTLLAGRADNNNPELDPITDSTFNEGSIATITPFATDPDGDFLTYSIDDLNFIWNTGSGSFEWQTGYNDSGIYPVTVTVDDGEGGTDSETFNVNVSNANQPPVLAPILGSTVNEGQTITITPSATDPDGDTLTYSSNNANLVWSAGSFTWVTGFTDAGTYVVTITADDGNGGTDPENVNITINNIAAALGWIGGGQNGWQTGNAPSAANDYQSFDSLSGVFVDSNGDIYVADSNNNRISKWNSNGNAVGWLGGARNGWQTGAAPAAADDYQSFDSPSGVSVDSNGDIYVADTLNNRVSKWDSSGNAVGWFGIGNGWQTVAGTVPTNLRRRFNGPMDIYVDSNGDIYVADTNNHRVSKWNSSATHIGWIGSAQNGWWTTSGGTAGSDYQSFDLPSGVFVDSSGNIYVGDSNNDRISQWDSSANAQGWLGGATNGWQTSTAPTSGTDYQSFDNPTGVFLDSNGNMYVSDSVNNRISKWNGSGNAQGWVGGGQNGLQTGNSPTWGTDYQSFDNPVGIYVTSTGAIYIADKANHRISKWQD
ncbi:Ig-like domain-containing protein [Nanoarchaeota archaeon]